MISNMKYIIKYYAVFIFFCRMHILIVFSNNDRICNKLLKQIKINVPNGFAAKYRWLSNLFN